MNPNTETLAIVLPVPAAIAGDLVVSALGEAVPGEGADDLHCTIAVVPAGDATKVVDAMRAVAAMHGPLGGALGPLGMFEGDAPSLHLAVACPGLVALRAAVVAALAEEGIEPSADHPFDPHVTLAYLDPGEDVQMPAEPKAFGTVTFRDLAVWDGTERTTFRLSGTGATDALACGEQALDGIDDEEPPMPDTYARSSSDADAPVPVMAAALDASSRTVSQTQLRVCLAISVGDTPPEALRLFAWGENESVKGTLTLDAEGAAEAIRRFDDHGVNVPVDFDHNTFSDSPEKKDTAGYYARLESREDGLWSAGIQWTAIGLKAVMPGVDDQGNKTIPEYRYYSPYVVYDKITRRIVEVGPLAITTWPATKNQQPMMLAAPAIERGDQPMNPTNVPATPIAQPAPIAAVPVQVPVALDAKTEAAGQRANQPGRRDGRTAARKLAMSFDEIRTAVCQALQGMFPDAWVMDVYDTSAVFMFGTACFTVDYSMNGSTAVLSGPATEVQRTYAPIPGGRSMQTVTETLSLNVGASEAEILRAVNKIKQEQAEAMRLLGAQTPAEAVEKITELQTSTERLGAVEAENADLKKRLDDQERDTLIAQGKREGKFSPADCKAFATDSVAEVRKFLSRMPVQPNLLSSERKVEVKTNGRIGTRVVDAEGRTFEKLSNMEKVDLKKSDPTLYADMRADWQARDRRIQPATATR
jgi:2'-5' RNA ligase